MFWKRLGARYTLKYTSARLTKRVTPAGAGVVGIIFERLLSSQKIAINQNRIVNRGRSFTAQSPSG